MSFDSSRITSNRKASGFTLIELLLVVAVILVLAGITFGISRGVRNAQARAQAKAELAVIAQALEVYKAKYGDYPWIGNNDVSSGNNDISHGLMKTLVGWQAVDGTQVGSENSNGVTFFKVPSVLDVSKLSLSQPWPPEDDSQEASPSLATYFIDPWGNPYVYVYKNPAQHQLGSNTGPWARFGYILFSTGSDGVASSSGLDENTGIMNDSGSGEDFRVQDENIDNIYYGE